MKVLNLQCAHQHSFEGWFASEDDFQSQLLRGLIACPLCDSKRIDKMPSAPRLNLGGHQQPAALTTNDAPPPGRAPDAPAGSGEAAPSRAIALSETPGDHASGQAEFLKALRHVIASTEDVGRRFADEARGMHYGDIEPRSIRGQTSAREAVELLEEGIDVMPLPAALKETLQ